MAISELLEQRIIGDGVQLITVPVQYWHYIVSVTKVSCSRYGGRQSLTSLAVTLSVTRGRAKMQKTLTSRLTRSTDFETDGHSGVVTVTLHCRESVVN